jgi:type I restriction enzyme M protein
MTFTESNTVEQIVVNPHKKPNVDTRTPEELMNIIEAKGKEVADALAALRGNRSQYNAKTGT